MVEKLISDGTKTWVSGASTTSEEEFFPCLAEEQ